MTPNHNQNTLQYLADLAPTGGKNTDVVQRSSEFVYLGWRPELMQPAAPLLGSAGTRGVKRTPKVRKLEAIDSLHSAERLLRLGWLFVVGRLETDAATTQFCLPLLSVPIRFQSSAAQYGPVHLGDVEMPEEFFDDDARALLEDSRVPYGEGAPAPTQEWQFERMPELTTWVRSALTHAGLPSVPLVVSQSNPLKLRSEPGLRVVPGAAIYSVRDVASPNVAGTLLGWMSQRLEGTAFEALYKGEVDSVPPVDSQSIRTPLPLNRGQLEALQRSRREHITVVSGPPGTGKSHLVAAAAINEVASGNSVLIATQSDHATGVIADMLDRHPGPRFVRFGSRDARESVAAELSDGLAQPLPSEENNARDSRAGEAGEKAQRTRDTIALLLKREAAFADGLRNRELNILVAAQAPGVLAADFDLAAAVRLLDRARSNSGFLGGWRQGRADKRLRVAVAAEPGATIEDLTAALDAASAEAAVKRGLTGGGLSLDGAWDELELAEAEWRNAIGLAIEATRRSRSNSRRKSTSAVAALASALRAGRVRRRQMLRELSGEDFLDVLPLWIGTLQDIDNTLPVTPGMFDVVIFDEASQIDQMRAAPALARANRAMVVGDPRQLRHVSFISDDTMELAAERRGLEGNRARLLDVRRNSLFDVAAAVSPVTWLDEHFRSVPHIIAFSDRAFYGGNLRLMTQHPMTETRDAIRTVRVDGKRNEQGINPTEVTAVLEQVRLAAAAGETSIGIVSPFRAQADALEEALLTSFSPEDIDRLGLRVGTVHAFQGSERDVVIASMVVAPDDPAGSLRFLQNPNLFNVLVTRARREMVVVTSIDRSDLSQGLLSDYLRHAEHPPLPSDAAVVTDGWAGEVYEELRVFNIPVTPNYPVAGWAVDLAVGTREHAFGVECRVHPEGATTHVEQHMALRRAGWKIVDAFQSRWLTDPEGAAEMLSKKVLHDDRG